MENKLSSDEEQFISYWEQNRLQQKKSLTQLMIGFPLGIVFGAPILLNAFTGWYKRADMQVNSRLNPAVLLIAVVSIIAFVAIFSRKHRWDQLELRYRELLARRDQKNDPQNPEPPAAKKEN